MKTKLYFTSILIFSILMSFAQDTIYKTNGSKIIAKVTEINASSIKYKFPNNGGELMAESSKSEIAYIVYSGGLKEIYNPIFSNKESTIVATELPEEMKPVSKLNNIIAINCFDMLFTNFSISYERSFSNGKFSVKIPLTVGLGGKPNKNAYSSSFGDTHFIQNKMYSAGLEFNIYPLGHTRNTFYIGLSGVYGAFNYYDPIFATAGYPYNYTYIASYAKYEASHVAGMIHIGGNLGLTDNLLIGTKFGVGYKKEDTIYEDFTLPKVQLDLNLAYRF